jgi:hypothetical protein
MDISGAYHIIQTACPIIEPEEWALGIEDFLRGTYDPKRQES